MQPTVIPVKSGPDSEAKSESLSSAEASLRPTEKARHFAYVDALRGYAFLGVMLIHSVDFLIFKTHHYPTLPHRLDKLAGDGRMGVQLFFVISALTLVLSSRSREGRERHPISNFYIRRLCRIAPLFWLAILAYTLIGGAPFAQHMWAPAGVGWQLILATATFTHGWYPTAINSVVPGGWSVAVEMSFYLFFPFLFGYLTSIRRALAAVGAAFLLSVVVNNLVLRIFSPHLAGPYLSLLGVFTTMWLPTQLPVFLTGFVLSFLVLGRQSVSDQSRHDDVRKKSLRLLGLFVLSVLLATFLHPVHHLHFDLIAPAVEFGVAFLFLAWGLSLFPWRLLVNRAICYVGLVSYSCYLTHFSIIYVVLPPIFFWLVRTLSLHLSSPVAVILYFFLALPLVVALSTLTYRFVELPGIALGKRLIERNERRGRD